MVVLDHVADTPDHAGSAGEVFDRAVAQCAAAADNEVPDLARGVAGALVQLTVDDQPAADTRANEDRHLLVVALARAGLVLAPCADVDVVIDDHRERQAFTQFFLKRVIDPA